MVCQCFCIVRMKLRKVIHSFLLAHNVYLSPLLQLMASLAAKLNYEPISYKNLSKMQSTNIAKEIYSSLPPPRPVNSSIYDTVPAPQEVPLERLPAEVQKQMHISLQPHVTSSIAETNADLPNLPPPPPPPPQPPPHSSCQTSELPVLPPPSTFLVDSSYTEQPSSSAAASEQPQSESNDWRYLEMRVAQKYNSTCYGNNKLSFDAIQRIFSHLKLPSRRWIINWIYILIIIFF